MPQLNAAPFGTTPKGEATLYTLTNKQGNTVKISDYGATITSIVVDGKEMVVGYDSVAGYLGEQPYFGALIGRYGNRIAGGKFSLDGKTYQLPVNNGPNCLHGGPDGFDKQLWTTGNGIIEAGPTLTLTHVSPDGDQGFPGRLEVSCVYEWTDRDELRINYTATTDKATVVNLTNHSYFNIGDAPTVEGLELELKADYFIPVDKTSIPTGKPEPVGGTPFDFNAPKPVGRDIRANHEQVQLANGYDHTWVIDDHDGSLKEFAQLRDPTSGRKLRAYTTEPGVQVFTANFDPGQFTGRDGEPLPTYGAICLETQHFPDSPNQPGFPSTVLRPGETYRSTTVYRFE